MRGKLNEDPKAQVLLVVVLVAVAGFLLLGKSGGGESESGESTPTEATVAVAGTPLTGTATGDSAGEAVEGAVEDALGATASSSPTATPGPMPVPRVPAPVLSAYRAGKTVVLLVVHDGGVDDRLVAGSVKRLAGEPGVETFVVPAKQIARYAAITLGVDVQQVPALVVMRPRRLSHGIPQATVDYGFQTPQSVVQAVVDASYKGPEVTYHPN